MSAVPPLAALRVPPVTCPAQQWAGATRRDRRRCNPPPTRLLGACHVNRPQGRFTGARRPGWSGRVEEPRQWGPPPGDPAGASRPSPLACPPPGARQAFPCPNGHAASRPPPSSMRFGSSGAGWRARAAKPPRGLRRGASSPPGDGRSAAPLRGGVDLLRPRRRRMGSVDRWPLAKPTIEHLETTPTAMARRLLAHSPPPPGPPHWAARSRSAPRPPEQRTARGRLRGRSGPGDHEGWKQDGARRARRRLLPPARRAPRGPEPRRRPSRNLSSKLLASP